MSNCTVVKAVLDYYDSKERLMQLTDLMNDAFIVFDYESIHSCKLSDVTSVIEKSWVKFTTYPIDFCEPDYCKIREASFRVSKAFITRQNFNNILAPYKKVIEEYASMLAAEVEEKHQHIIKLYDNFELFDKSNYACIFKLKEFQEAFVQFLMS